MKVNITNIHEFVFMDSSVCFKGVSLDIKPFNHTDDKDFWFFCNSAVVYIRNSDPCFYRIRDLKTGPAVLVYDYDVPADKPYRLVDIYNV